MPAGNVPKVTHHKAGGHHQRFNGAAFGGTPMGIPELRQLLLEVLEQAEEGAEYVISR